MTEDELAEHKAVCLVIRNVVSVLRLTGVEDEDVEVAAARLDNWLSENDGRWVKPVNPLSGRERPSSA